MWSQPAHPAPSRLPPPAGPHTQAATVLLFCWLLLGWLLPTLLLLHPSGVPPRRRRVRLCTHSWRCWAAAAGTLLARCEHRLLVALHSLTAADANAARRRAGQRRRQQEHPEHPDQEQQQQRVQDEAQQEQAAQGEDGEMQPAEDGDGLSPGVQLALRWLTLLVLLWLPCRTVAPWYTGEGGALSVQRAH